MKYSRDWESFSRNFALRAEMPENLVQDTVVMGESGSFSSSCKSEVIGISDLDKSSVTYSFIYTRSISSADPDRVCNRR